jgi:hypothetical protein
MARTMTAPARSAVPASALAVLAGWDDDRLRELLRVRPDLVSPPPRTMAALAERVTSPASAEAAYERLDRSAQQVAEVMDLLAPSVDVDVMARLIAPGVRPEQLERSLAVLEAAALAFAEGGLVTLNPGLRGIGARTGLGPPMAALLHHVPASDLAEICRRLGLTAARGKEAMVAAITAHVGHPVHARRLVAAGPVGTTELAEAAARDCRIHDISPYALSDRTPAGWLARRGLLATFEWYRLVMPSEVGLALRGGQVFEEFWPDEPEVPTEPVEAAVVDAAGAEQALQVVADLATMLEAWVAEAPKLLKDGGVGVRDVRRTARATDRPEREVARLLDVAAAAGLVWVDERAGVALPTAAFDEWLGLHGPARWARLVGGWIEADFDPSVAGAIDVKDKRIPPLLRRHSATAAGRRRAVLDALAGLPVGRAAADGPALSARARWSTPALWAGEPAPERLLAAWVVEEAELLGVYARGSLTSAGRLAVAGDLAGATAALAERAPAPVERFVLQGDLTVVAPGVLEPQVAAELELLADVESRGAATVYRIAERTLRRAFDSGRSAAQVSDFLERHAAHGVPQALAYLVADVGRRHGQARIGEARCYVRSDDAALVAELARARALAGLGLRLLAPTVAVTGAEPAAVLEAMRGAGYLPAPEDSSGALVITRPAVRRAPARVRPKAAAGAQRPQPGGKAPTGAGVEAVVAGLRRGGAQPAPAAPSRPKAARPPLPAPPSLFSEGTPRPLAIAKGREEVGELLELACEEEWLVRISYVNGKGKEAQLNVAVADVSPRNVLVSVLPRFNSRTLNRFRVQWARVLTEAEEDQLL